MNRWFSRMLAVTVGVTALVGAYTAQAQQNGQRGQRGIFRLSVLGLPAPLHTKLQITADQKTKLEAIQMRLRTEAQAAGQGNFQEVRARREKANEEALAILTADQKTRFEALRMESDKYAGLGRAGTALLVVDGLTADQKSKLEALSMETRTKQRELFQGAGQGADRQALAEKFRAMETETVAAVTKVLTADQAKTFDTTLKAIPAGRGFGRRPGGNNNNN